MPTSESLPNSTLVPVPKNAKTPYGRLYDAKAIKAEVEQTKIMQCYAKHIADTNAALKIAQQNSATAKKAARKAELKILQAYKKLGKLIAYQSLMRAQLYNQMLHKKLEEARRQLLNENRQG